MLFVLPPLFASPAWWGTPRLKACTGSTFMVGRGARRRRRRLDVGLCHEVGQALRRPGARSLRERWRSYRRILWDTGRHRIRANTRPAEGPQGQRAVNAPHRGRLRWYMGLWGGWSGTPQL